MGSVLVPGSLKLDDARGGLPPFCSFCSVRSPGATAAGGGIQQPLCGRLPAATSKQETPATYLPTYLHVDDCKE